ncbi:hypothetical protein R1flu_003539 [Riccia fluitans]|uniref:Uncharacterized protein n=1 Tax=Riccia fluitans TaxID=41844 RepID=A0ABD1YA96_9MARC
MDGPVQGLLHLAAKKFEHHIRRNLRNGDEHKYQEFKELMTRFKNMSIGFQTLKVEIHKLFPDYPDLKGEFTRFLTFPEDEGGYKNFVDEALEHMGKVIETLSKVQEEYKAGRMSLQDFLKALSFIHKDHAELSSALLAPLQSMLYRDAVREYFAEMNQETKYDEFVRFLRDAKAHDDSFSEVRARFIDVFWNHHNCDLMRHFNMYLPIREWIVCHHPTEARHESEATKKGDSESTGAEWSVIQQSASEAGEAPETNGNPGSQDGVSRPDQMLSRVATPTQRFTNGMCTIC